MPEGIIVGKWDDVQGVVLHAKYPETVEIADYNLMRIFTSHAVGEAQAGFLALTLEEENMNVASYFTGISQKPQYFISLLLSKDEDAKNYEESLLDIATELLEKIDEPNFNEILAEAFQRVSKAIVLTDEQRLAYIFKDDVHKLAYERLIKGPATASMIVNYIQENSGVGRVNPDLLISPLIRLGYAAQGWAPGYAEQFIFLVRDFTIIRAPAEKIIKQAVKGEPSQEIAKRYLKSVKEFFTNYNINIDESGKLAEILINPEYYEIIKILREKPLLSTDIKACLGQQKLGCEAALKSLEEANIVETFPAEGKEDTWVLLKSDIVIHTFFPEYLLEVLRSKLAAGELSSETAIKHLELLQQNYSS
ncbi:MAG: hypothetical protein OdinLCB4_001190 [Candidatus Odinarchaeum yellowstonii]|uniref:Uncharacterized protein n=1 Tax=Odinarchaeota yellowstonii (strain LCB_4) TaxID=1841599 RepID=A0AAF0D2P6_ODILC|nr:MAG: hypothetical protein OdinLCB4_001190 [Candidatus Odinarchaeum yellowstonii]